MTDSLPVTTSDYGSLLNHSPDLEYAEDHDRRLLIVDDEEPVRNLFAAYLEGTYTCETAGDAHEALDMLAREPYALVLSDMQMPAWAASSCCARLSSAIPRQP